MKKKENNHTIPEGHPDRKKLMKAFELRNNWDIRSCSSARDGEGHYINQGYKYWDHQPMEKYKLYRKIEELNRETIEYEFRIWFLKDYEIEYDYDRAWQASFSFGAYKKKKDEK